MSWAIRPFKPTSDEYEAILALHNALFPDNPSTVAIWRHGDASRPSDSKFERLVAVDENGRLIAYAQFAETTPGSGKFAFNWQLRPSHWQSDLAETLYQEMISRLSVYQPVRLTIHVQESEQEKLSFLKARHFEMVMRSPLSQLNVAGFEAERFTAVLEKVSASGIRLSQPPPGWQHDPDWQHFIHDLDWSLMQYVPHHEPRSKTPFDQFVKEELQHPNFMPDGYFIAYDGDQPVGMTNFVKRGGTVERLGTSVTGVNPAYRRRGIATALKVTSIIFAQQLGTKIIITDNEENNPMYLLNLQLGFEPQPAWTDWEKPWER